LVEAGEFYELKYYGVSNFWGVTEGMGSSFTLVFHRIGVVMAVGAVCAFLARFIKKLPKIMNQMSRNTLWLYVGHLILLYVVRPKFNNGRYDVGPTMFAVALMYLLMIIQTLVIEKKNELGTWKAYLVFTSNKLKEFLPRKR
jgi:fucose 4-O-acetylase-like acetyltransferase